MNNESAVFIVDDDPGVRKSLTSLMRSIDLETAVFHSAREFLDFYNPLQSGCLLLEVRPGETSGLDLLEGINNPILRVRAVVISAHGEVRTVVRAMRAGALNFLEKPCRNRTLWEAIQECFAWDAANRRRLVQSAKISRRLERLTQGEYDVLMQITEGKSNKGIATELCISVRAVEVRRSKVMKKMKAAALADLIRMTTLISFPDDEDFIKRTTGKITKSLSLMPKG